jgi:heme oxygenase
LADVAGKLSSRLREAVWPIHRRIEALPYFDALARRSLPVERYVDQLRGMAIVTAALERAVAASADPSVGAAATGLAPRLALLLADLAYFDRRGPLPDDPGPASEALAFAREIVRVAVEEPVRLLGVLYVSEGTAMGNLVHLEDARVAAGGADGASWYAGRGGETGYEFQAFRERLDALCTGEAAALDEEARGRVVDAAVAAGGALERFHAALDPALRPERRLLAVTLNVEAGSHDVPADPEVAAASGRAGDHCLEEFPYFLERWGERGLRYTRSDAAWLAALAALGPDESIPQVLWLAGVLARRGMPSLLLERQLVLLEEELGRIASPARWSFLGEAARVLRSRREEWLPGGAAMPLADAFAASAGWGTEAERRQAATLLLSAVADELSGLSGAVAAVTSWYRGERFPECWREAVDRLVGGALSASPWRQ